uniref:Uncharacterized protein n=1 Tax=Loa loa TaxID=7209 RepID=A0A1I7VQ95_LOALO
MADIGPASRLHPLKSSVFCTYSTCPSSEHINEIRIRSAQRTFLVRTVMIP